MLVVFEGQGIGSSWRFCPRQPGLCVCIRWCVLSRAPISFGVFNRLSTDKFELGCSELRVHGQCSLGFSLTRRALRVYGQYSLTADNVWRGRGKLCGLQAGVSKLSGAACPSPKRGSPGRRGQGLEKLSAFTRTLATTVTVVTTTTTATAMNSTATSTTSASSTSSTAVATTFFALAMQQ